MFFGPFLPSLSVIASVAKQSSLSFGLWIASLRSQ